MATHYDVIIIGAGPAGTTCARLLARANAKVLLIDKALFPRDKPCGDYISARLSTKLQQLDLLPSLKGVSPCYLGDLLFTHPTSGSFNLCRPPLEGFVCKRFDFDSLLFEAARKEVDVLEGVAVKKILFDGGRAVGVQADAKTFYATVIVGADGANGICAKALGVETFDENHNAVALRAYYTNVKDLTDSIELHFLDEVQPGYFWIFPLNKQTGEANVGLGMLSRNVRNSNVHLKDLLPRITQEHPQFKDRFTEASPLSPIKGWSLPFGSKKRPVVFNGALLIGDAAGLIDPMSGEGIENGVRSAECAALAIQKALAANDLSFLKSYQKELESLLRAELRRSYWIQKACRSPTMLKMFFHLLKRSSAGRKILVNKFF